MGLRDNLYMGIKNLFAFLLLPSLALAQAPSAKDVVDLFNETQQKMKALSGPDPSCFTCQFTMSPESSKTGQSKVCDDLFGASCLGTDGKSKYEGRAKSLPQELNKSIIEARNKTAVLMGFKDFDDALKSKLKEAGLEIKEPLDADAWKNLKREGDSFSQGGDNAKKLYSSVAQCDKDREELQAIQYYSMTDINQLTETAKKYDAFQAKYREQSINLYAKDIPNFISNQIGSKCSSLKSNPSSYKPEENKEVIAACDKISQLKRQAVNLFRIEGTPQYKEQAEKFVRENLLPELKYSYSSTTTSTPTSPPPEKTDVEKLRDTLQTASNSLSNYCYSYSSLVENAGNKVFQDFVGEVNTAKPTVDAVIDSFYSESKKKMATQMFQESRSDIQGIVSQFVKDPSKKTEIVDGYDRLKLFWMEKPADTAYKRNDKGILVLDEAKASPAYVRMFNDDVYGTFSDPSLSFFTTLNANYMPPVNMGKSSNAERVNMMPAFIKLSEKNPYAFLAVIAHEAGHKIGPEVSRINGYDLTPEYKDLLTCYKDSKSINLQSGQEDETIADYISSEVLARQISRLPAEKRQQALMSSMEDFCIFEDSDSGVNCKGSHPENSLRVAGIYGANPNLRKAVGCNADSPKFKSCGLSKISLPSDTGNKGSSQEASTSKGVQ